MSLPIAVFVSSGCYELRDIRVSIRDLLKNFGITSMLSEDKGFPHESGVKPYVTCLDTMEQCPLVVGVLEREYGLNYYLRERFELDDGSYVRKVTLSHSCAAKHLWRSYSFVNSGSPFRSLGSKSATAPYGFFPLNIVKG